MNEEQFTIHDEKELFEELSKDKCKRSDILINLNVALQKYQNIVANIKGIREIQEYKIAVVTIENELQKVQEENQELKNQQKEFIEYLENKISELNEITKNEEDEETIHYALVRITAINELIHEINKIRKEINNDD